jgi:hypothetical protein
MQSNILTPSFSTPGSETIDRAVDSFPPTVQYVGIHHCRFQIPMSEEFLNCADIIAIFQQVCGKRVP